MLRQKSTLPFWPFYNNLGDSRLLFLPVRIFSPMMAVGFWPGEWVKTAPPSSPGPMP
jgi:hypothetical protein